MLQKSNHIELSEKSRVAQENRTHRNDDFKLSECKNSNLLTLQKEEKNKSYVLFFRLPSAPTTTKKLSSKNFAHAHVAMMTIDCSGKGVRKRMNFNKWQSRYLRNYR